MNLSKKNPSEPINPLLVANIAKGKVGEKIAEMDYKNNGYTVIRTGVGSDFVAVKRTIDSSKPYVEYVEVKTGKSRPSKRQRVVMRNAKKSGKGYTIYRISEAFLATYLGSADNRSNGE